MNNVDNSYEGVWKRINIFLNNHKNVILNPTRKNEIFIMNVSKVGGRCPCDSNRPTCPCNYAYDELLKNGSCKCGLFILEK